MSVLRFLATSRCPCCNGLDTERWSHTCRQYGSGYPGVNGLGVTGRNFPFVYWPFIWGGGFGYGAAYLHTAHNEVSTAPNAILRMFSCSRTAPADFYARPSSRALVRRAKQLVTPGRPARASGLLLQHAEHDLPRRLRQQHRRRAHRLHLLQLHHRLQFLHRADRVQRERE